MRLVSSDSLLPKKMRTAIEKILSGPLSRSLVDFPAALSPLGLLRASKLQCTHGGDAYTIVLTGPLQSLAGAI